MLSTDIACPECGEYRMVFTAIQLGSGDRVQCRGCNAIGYTSTCWVRTGKAGDINPTRERRTKEQRETDREAVYGSLLEESDCRTCDNTGARHSGVLCPDCDA